MLNEYLCVLNPEFRQKKRQRGGAAASGAS